MTIVMKTTPKYPFLDGKSAIVRARRLESARNMFVVMCLCSVVVVSYLNVCFDPLCARKDFLTACCFLLLLLVAACCCCCLLKCVGHPWTLKSGVKPLKGKPCSVTSRVF